MFTSPGRTSVLEAKEAFVVAASVTPATWRRRAMLSAEIELTRRSWPCLGHARLVIRWATVSLEFRGPTTVASYLRTVLSMVAVDVRKDPLLAAYIEGLNTLYGSQPMNSRVHEAYTRMEVMQLMVRIAVEWAGARLDMTWSAGGRDADLTYLYPTDVSVLECEKKVEVYFRFLKNDKEGRYGVRKRFSLLNWDMTVNYVQRMQRGSEEALFPQEYEEYLTIIKKAGARYGTRGIRRGAAQELARSGTKEQVQKLLGHRNEHTQQRVAAVDRHLQHPNSERLVCQVLNDEQQRTMK